jgi:hypothetical protein
MSYETPTGQCVLCHVHHALGLKPSANRNEGHLRGLISPRRRALYPSAEALMPSACMGR